MPSHTELFRVCKIYEIFTRVWNASTWAAGRRQNCLVFGRAKVGAQRANVHSNGACLAYILIICLRIYNHPLHCLVQRRLASCGWCSSSTHHMASRDVKNTPSRLICVGEIGQRTCKNALCPKDKDSCWYCVKRVSNIMHLFTTCT